MSGTTAIDQVFTVVVNDTVNQITISNENDNDPCCSKVVIDENNINTVEIIHYGPQGQGSGFSSGSIQVNNDPVNNITNLNFSGSGISSSISGSTLTIDIPGVQYVTNSSAPINEIEVIDYSNDVAVAYVSSSNRLRFIFGSPSAPTVDLLTFNNTFNTDRFNQVLDIYDVSGSWTMGQYDLIEANLYNGNDIVPSIVSNNSIRVVLGTSGSQTYTLAITASSPLDNSIFSQSLSLTGTLNKIPPANPIITASPLVQLGASNYQIEQGATGSIPFSATTGSANDWEYISNTLTITPTSSPIYVTGSATGSSAIPIFAAANYISPGTTNNPVLTYNPSSLITYNKIRSVRYGVSSQTSFTYQELEKIDLWDTSLGGTIGTIAKGTIDPNNFQFTITTNAQYIYVIYDVFQNDLTGILNVYNSNANDLPGAFNGPISIGTYKVYRSKNLSATTILFKLTT